MSHLLATDPTIAVRPSFSRVQRSAFSRYEWALLLLFFLTLPLVNPWVRGDGVGYYAYVRSLLIEHHLGFENDWRVANSTFSMGRVDKDGHVKADQYTSTRHIANLWAVGPSFLWAPFLGVVHLFVLGLNRLGAHIPADGFSRPYLVAMALATAAYGFVGLYLAFHLARNYFKGRWAFLGTLGIWFASSVPVYMYFNPSWSHAHSVFVVSLFLWYWHRTRGARALREWAVLGLCAGLMINVYYPNAVLLLVPLLEACVTYWRGWRWPQGRWAAMRRLFSRHVLFAAMALLALLPTLVTRQIIFGSVFKSGYADLGAWAWTSPALAKVLFSANHGLLSWTPIVALALLGLPRLWRIDREMTAYLLAALVSFYYLIASHLYWHGMSSFGNRFFISLTPVFILGLTAALAGLEEWFASARRAFATAACVTGLFIVWNAGFIFQWGTHLVPARGPISWGEMVHNQVAVVPVRLAHTLKVYMVGRSGLMERIEKEDFKQLSSGHERGQ